jgi:hypothetical protein
MILIISFIGTIISIFGYVFGDERSISRPLCFAIFCLSIFLGFIILGTSVPVDTNKQTVDFELTKYQNCVSVVVPDKKHVELFDSVNLYNSSEDELEVYWIEDFNSYGKSIGEYMVVKGQSFKLEGEKYVK